MATSCFERALAAIDAAHAEDPNLIRCPDGPAIPYELHYALKMTKYLHLLLADGGEEEQQSPSELLSLAIRAQHFRRWTIPRSDYPMTKVGYHAWRNALKRKQADEAGAICLEAGYSEADVQRIEALIRKEGLKEAGETEDAQVLEDVACAVFLDGQLADFACKFVGSQDYLERSKGTEDGDCVKPIPDKEQQEHEAKLLEILRKTWAKMSPRGRNMALKIDMKDTVRRLVEEALSGDKDRSDNPFPARLAEKAPNYGSLTCGP
jgi:Domain of unknown function (DUF4202)